MGTEGDNFRVIAGRYRLEAKLGRGGMGVVWRAADQLLGRQVAVKELVLDPSLAEEESRRQRERTLREARAVAQLQHPHIIVVHDVVEHDERPYIVMELIDGGSLEERIAADGPVDAREAARIGIDLLGALRRAHEAGVLHRDLKPANVLMESGTDRVVLTDFGIAQVAGATTLTESGSFVGSPEYTAPERMSGARTGPESDLWSLGALLCTVLSGESPFHRDSLGGILHAVVVDEIRPPTQAAPLLPVVRGLLERDPEQRLDATEAERLLRAYRETGRTPRVTTGRTPRETTGRTPRETGHTPWHHGRTPWGPATGYTPTQRDAPRPPSVSREAGETSEAEPQDAAPQAALHQPSPAPGPGSGTPGRAAAEHPVRHPTRGVLVAAALVAAMAGAGVSAAALLMRDGGDGGGTPTSSAPRTPGDPPVSTPSPTATDSPPNTSPPPPTSLPTATSATSPGATPAATPSRAATAPAVPSGYRLAEDPRGFALAVPEGFTRKPQGERIFYVSPGERFRLGIRTAAPGPDGPLAVMWRAHAKGPSTYPGYRDGRVTRTKHDGRPAALWEYTWNGAKGAKGPRHTYELCWKQGGQLYEVWVTAPVGRVSEAKEYFDVAVDTFARTSP